MAHPTVSPALKQRAVILMQLHQQATAHYHYAPRESFQRKGGTIVGRVMHGVVLGAVVLLFGVGSALATPSHGVNRSDLGRYTVVASQASTIAEGSDVIVQSITLE